MSTYKITRVDDGFTANGWDIWIDDEDEDHGYGLALYDGEELPVVYSSFGPGLYPNFSHGWDTIGVRRYVLHDEVLAQAIALVCRTRGAGEYTDADFYTACCEAEGQLRLWRIDP